MCQKFSIQSSLCVCRTVLRALPKCSYAVTCYIDTCPALAMPRALDPLVISNCNNQYSTTNTQILANRKIFVIKKCFTCKDFFFSSKKFYFFCSNFYNSLVSSILSENSNILPCAVVIPQFLYLLLFLKGLSFPFKKFNKLFYGILNIFVKTKILFTKLAEYAYDLRIGSFYFGISSLLICQLWLIPFHNLFLASLIYIQK